MKDLIKALEILLKYRPNDVEYPFWCEHDILHIAGINPSIVSEEDKRQLEELGIAAGIDEFYSFKYGSC